MAESAKEILKQAVKSYNENDVFTAVDIETTGLDPVRDRIVEIGAVKFDKNGLMARYSTLINPGIPMPAEASKVNNITDEMLKNQPCIEKIIPDFLQFIKNTILVAHNAPFDFGFIDECMKKTGNEKPSLTNLVMDTLVLSREAFPGRPGYSLQKLAAGLGIKAGNAHRAEDDAKICMEIFLRCIDVYQPIRRFDTIQR